MLRMYMILLAGTLTVASPADGQEVKEQDRNVHYEKLKVLEPIIGTWGARGINDATGEQTEYQITFSWSANKKMILCASTFRTAKAGADLAAQEFTEGGPLYYYIWNARLGRIEQIALYTRAGEASVSHVEPKESGKFALTVVHAANNLTRGDAELTVSETELSRRLFNRQGDDGEAWEDIRTVLTRATGP